MESHLQEAQRQKEIKLQKEIERRQEIERQKDDQMKELQKEIQRLRDLEQQRLERQKTALDSQAQDIVASHGMDVDVEPGEVTPEGNAVIRTNPSPRREPTPPVLKVSDGTKRRRSESPPRNESSHAHYRRRVSPRRQEPRHREYPSSQYDRHSSARHYRPRSPERFTRRGRSPSPTRGRDNYRHPNRYHDTAHHSGHRSPSPHRGPPSKRRHIVNYPSTNVSSTAPSIPGTLSLPMGCLQFMPSSTVTTVAGFNRMGPRPIYNRVTRLILDRLPQLDEPNPLSLSVEKYPQNRLLHIACYPPYHLLHVMSRGRLVVSKSTEVRLRLWRAQYPDVPLWFFAIRCLTRGLDWRVFANPQHLIGPLGAASGPRPKYLDQRPLLLRRRRGVFEQYDNDVRDMLRLPFARRFCCMGSLSWRLAMQFGPDNLISAALSGPSTDASIHSNVERIGTDVDDTVTDAHINLLLGLTDDDYTLWPPMDIFAEYMGWEGEWTASLERWFSGQITAIQQGDWYAFATRSQWTSRLSQQPSTSSKDTMTVTEGQAELLCYDVDKLDPRSFAALD
ncbi:hypothetical protein BDR07DRAFT_1497599 [Suillus spraguei]|nr:hypothetical protein BDR07DRAFT_1497599 [Suillus spraguei]